ncbi:branched-chain amino acid ABC transporter permease [Salinisphaera orenii MK-B5]|uniref:Branched-chain amino acid ABC transporter permease n=1 Tax=Salinisphaera orenii MK-B5 TaxID=856730 RepID=A0A423PP15_9GAMM|nr:branched-chain amino acid ABC transporter permease [Salinisphaera orenii]ROO27366.1 branched-chain amino acid ABC transporter permease [Salinisphaera orenii MK-B5]
MPSPSLFFAQLFNGLALGSLLALVSAGLTIILGTLGVLNFAHGAMFMVAAYVAWWTMVATQSYVLAALAACAVLVVLGMIIERGIIQFYYSRPPEDQILVTFGIGVVLVEVIRVIFGGISHSMPVPDWGSGIVNMGFLIYPKYRVLALGIIAVALLALYLVLYRTRLGLIVRAGIEDQRMVGLLGINVKRTFLAVFALGSLAVGFAGAVYAPIIAVNPEMGEQLLVQSFVVVVIGGLGSFPGAVIGGLIAGEILTLTTMFNPAYSHVMLYLAMAVVLVLRPQGLFGVEGRE